MCNEDENDGARCDGSHWNWFQVFCSRGSLCLRQQEAAEPLNDEEYPATTVEAPVPDPIPSTALVRSGLGSQTLLWAV